MIKINNEIIYLIVKAFFGKNLKSDATFAAKIKLVGEAR